MTARNIIDYIMDYFPAVHEDVWLKEKKKCLSGTEIGTLFGRNPYQTRWQLYRDKLDPEISKQDSIILDRGHALEAVVIKRYQKETGNEIFPTSFSRNGDRFERLIKHPEFDYIGGTVDSLAIDQQGNLVVVEIKTAYSFGTEKWADGPPEVYIIQLQHYLSILNAIIKIFPDFKGGVYADLAWVVNDQFGMERNINLHPGLEEAFYKAANEFWHGNVLAKIPPIAQTSEDARAKYADVIPDKTIAVDKDFVDLCKERQKLRALLAEPREMVETIKLVIDEFEKRILDTMQENTIAEYNGEVIATWHKTKKDVRSLIISNKILDKIK